MTITMRVAMILLLLAPLAAAGDPPPAAEVQLESSSASYSMDWYVLNANAVGLTGSASYAANLTVGQAPSGATSGGGREAGIGYWYGAASGPLIFSDGFESGDTDAWSTVAPSE